MSGHTTGFAAALRGIGRPMTNDREDNAMYAAYAVRCLQVQMGAMLLL